MNFFREIYNYRVRDINIFNVLIITGLLLINIPIDIMSLLFNIILYSGLCYLIIMGVKFREYIFNMLRNINNDINSIPNNIAGIPDNILDDIASEAAHNYVNNIHPHPQNLLRRFSIEELRGQLSNENLRNNTRYNRNNNIFESLDNEQLENIENSLFSREGHVSRTLSTKNKRDAQRKYIMQLPTCTIDSGDCPYCLDEMHANDNVIGLCGHKYHRGCVVQHFNHCFQNNQLFKCPVCRSDWC